MPAVVEVKLQVAAASATAFPAFGNSGCRVGGNLLSVSTSRTLLSLRIRHQAGFDLVSISFHFNSALAAAAKWAGPAASGNQAGGGLPENVRSNVLLTSWSD
jgi:hypothetical protein